MFEFTIGEFAKNDENRFFVSGINGRNYYEYLIFLDSRGGKINNMNLLHKTIIYRLKKYLDKKDKSYIIISRPKNLTTFATLINFVISNNFKFKYLITNVGFVDFTPKKQDNINDIIVQIKKFYNKELEIIDFDRYKLNNSEIVKLKSIKYTNRINNLLSKKFEKCFFLNTPIVDKNEIFERKRLDEFYTQLKKTNQFTQTIASNNSKSNINYTFDGVHYTNKGHKLISKMIINMIKGL